MGFKLPDHKDRADVAAKARAAALAKFKTAAETTPESAAIKVPPGDATAFRDAVARALDDAGLRQRMADAAWVAGQALPRWSDTARIIADVLQKVTV